MSAPSPGCEPGPPRSGRGVPLGRGGEGSSWQGPPSGWRESNPLRGRDVAGCSPRVACRCCAPVRPGVGRTGATVGSASARGSPIPPGRPEPVSPSSGAEPQRGVEPRPAGWKPAASPLRLLRRISGLHAAGLWTGLFSTGPGSRFDDDRSLTRWPSAARLPGARQGEPFRHRFAFMRGHEKSRLGNPGGAWTLSRMDAIGRAAVCTGTRREAGH